MITSVDVIYHSEPSGQQLLIRTTGRSSSIRTRIWSIESPATIMTNYIINRERGNISDQMREHISTLEVRDCLVSLDGVQTPAKRIDAYGYSAFQAEWGEQSVLCVGATPTVDQLTLCMAEVVDLP